jgi:hypothetical protein
MFFVPFEILYGMASRVSTNSEFHFLLTAEVQMSAFGHQGPFQKCHPNFFSSLQPGDFLKIKSLLLASLCTRNYISACTISRRKGVRGLGLPQLKLRFKMRSFHEILRNSILKKIMWRSQHSKVVSRTTKHNAITC